MRLEEYNARIATSTIDIETRICEKNSEIYAAISERMVSWHSYRVPGAFLDQSYILSLSRWYGVQEIIR